MTAPPPRRPDPEELADAAAEVVDCMRVLAKSGSSLVLEALGGRDFVQLDHYPPGDIIDLETGSQAYFHAHPPSPAREADFGHFHCFLRPPALAAGARALDLPGNTGDRPVEAQTCHLAALSMDRYGRPTALFTTNRWVTDETLYDAETLIEALPRFALDLARPSWPLNRWLTAMVTLYRDDIADLLRQRDQALAATGPEDRAVEVLSRRPVDLDARLAEVREMIDDK